MNEEEESDIISIQSDPCLDDEIDEVVKTDEEFENPEDLFNHNYDLQDISQEVSEPYRPEEIDSQRDDYSPEEEALSEKSDPK
mmetsp:Transcript_24181/g.37194  ORF Transcript_24181/g.37194 Transcript_24181/m.37194 type:complete len:83 (+) Transcript_24181:2062-2310(+)